jgi:hypothetical protein
MEYCFVDVKSKGAFTYGEAVKIGAKPVDGIGKQKAKDGRTAAADEGRNEFC